MISLSVTADGLVVQIEDARGRLWDYRCEVETKGKAWHCALTKLAPDDDEKAKEVGRYIIEKRGALWACTCKDYGFRCRGFPDETCKHIRAAKELYELTETMKGMTA